METQKKHDHVTLDRFNAIVIRLANKQRYGDDNAELNICERQSN
jgi:hypothetical protein